jgi:hypothetical protein
MRAAHPPGNGCFARVCSSTAEDTSAATEFSLKKELLMAYVDGKGINSGLIHFIGDEVAQSGTTPVLNFKADNTGPAGVATATAGINLVFSANLAPGGVFAGAVEVDIGTSHYRAVYVVARIAELPRGALYEARYTLSHYQ